MTNKCSGAFLFWILIAASGAASEGGISLLRTPEQGLQPQAAVDSQGTVHLVYYKGQPDSGDIIYVQRAPHQGGFSTPIRVNHQLGSAMAMGTIRGAQLALGKNDRVHVLWNGMGKGARPLLLQGKAAAPLLYARLNDEKTAFEPERNIITYAAGLDGGSSVAADRDGNVYVTWHAPLPGDANKEVRRALFVARSQDEGRSFQREFQALSQLTGACPCCGLRAFADRTGAVYLLFRSETEAVHRDELLLVARHPGNEFAIAHADNWTVGSCPMSSASLSQANDGVLAAWETAGQVYCAKVNPRSLEISPRLSPSGGVTRKHPVAVANRQGEILLAWIEGTTWGKGGAVAWQVFDPHGRSTPQKGRAEGVPAWSLATAFAQPDGQFVIIY